MRRRLTAVFIPESLARFPTRWSRGTKTLCYHVSDSEKYMKGVQKGVVSKETVMLRRWGSSIQKFGFINGVDNVNWPPYRDSKG